MVVQKAAEVSIYIQTVEKSTWTLIYNNIHVHGWSMHTARPKRTHWKSFTNVDICIYTVSNGSTKCWKNEGEKNYITELITDDITQSGVGWGSLIALSSHNMQVLSISPHPYRTLGEEVQHITSPPLYHCWLCQYLILKMDIYPQCCNGKCSYAAGAILFHL